MPQLPLRAIFARSTGGLEHSYDWYGVSVGSFSPTLGRHHIFSEYAGCNP
jgi:hypothetical protein